VAKTVKTAFDEYKANLNLTSRQETLVSERRANVVRALKKELSLHSEESKVIGSWDRSTITRYLSEGDVDVMVILHYGQHKDWDNADGTIKSLDKFRSILVDAYPSTTIRRDRNCVTMGFSEFRLDVVPAFKHEDGYYRIPDSIRKLWVKTDPFKFAEGVTSINKSMEATFVPLIKMIKGWNRDVDWPIRSFHLECIMHNRYQGYTKGYTYSSMVKLFLEALPGYLRASCYDPIMGDRVDTYMDNAAAKPRRTIAIEKAEAAAKAAKAAFDLEESDQPESIRKWKALLGEFFPSYG
jgi:hypothetical protein